MVEVKCKNKYAKHNTLKVKLKFENPNVNFNMLKGNT